MRFVYFTDPHIMGTNPKSRKDDFPTTILSKLKEVGEIANSITADAVLCGGDLFNRPDTSPSIVKAVCEVLYSYSCPLYGVGGNHDFYGYNPDTIPRTMLGVLIGAGLYKLLSPNRPAVFFDDVTQVNITGCHSHYELDKNGNVEHYSPSHEHDGVNIHIVHGFLADHKWHDAIPHTTIDQIADNTKAHIVLAGHEHSGFGVVKRNGKIFCNPGSLGRVAASIGEISRDVKVAIVNVENGGFDVTLMPLKCAQPASEVLDREQLEKEKQQKVNLEKCIEGMSTFQVQASNLFEVMDWIAKQENEKSGKMTIGTNVIKEARRRLQVAHEARGGNIDDIE